ncbi:uncharacterized protein C18orf8-like [Chenopodium quinoa]|uniref:uncharacterized protein C18orf8-like n=1 Tax=Chenopodium quinoa TaxID=63459 RepID=UPI000B76FBCC|nr:uncharacterized protein C18orf8-like [Chenopodium quinoa]XP_021721621.1 uncharacterized protein C18orf8-like [Chenopodium quinoa]XP_021721622.1 uncharacterized protein C18orf8-like [Chenopodium quinoa]XP_021721623.1 uncharacterized protein C18orf8-like [Chenopodium quinoa]
MNSEASSSQASIGLSGSGALSHVYIQYPPLKCSFPGSKSLFYDDGNKLLLSPTSDQVISWKIAPFEPNVEPTSDSVSEGPVLSVRYSLDNKIIAIQRSIHEIHFWNKEKGNSFSHRCKPESEKILGFFWTDSSACNFVLVKTSGLDMLTYDSESQNIQLIESKRVNVNWYIYTHESRLVLLASGMQCKSFTGFQLSSAGIIRLPKFEMLMAKSEANSKPILAAQDVHIITVYGRIYCLQVDRVAMLLHCYRFYRDAVVPQGSLPIYSSKVSVSVVDNVLLVHQVDAKVVILYDLFAESRAPISAPLPLLLRGYPRASMFSTSSPCSKGDGRSEPQPVDEDETTIYRDGWTFLNPDLICDTRSGLLWKIHLDLDSISASSSDVPSVLEFLQRRKLEANKAKQLCLDLARTIILEHREVGIVAQSMDVLMTSYSRAIKTGSYFKGIIADKILSSDVQPAHNPRPGTDEFSRGDSSGVPIKMDSSVIPDEYTRSSTISHSDLEGKVSLSSARSKLVEGAQSSGTRIQQSSLESEVPGPSSVPLDANNLEQQESQITTAAISPDELYRFVFSSVDEEMTGDPAYLVSILVEFLRSATLERIRVYPSLYVLMIQLLARGGRFGELGLFVIDKIIEPSKEVAYQLLESGRQHPPTRKLGMDMLRQLFLHHDYVLSLLQDGYYLEALRYARKYKVVTVQPSLFLEAAYVSNDSQHLASVLRFFSDFMPGFKNTSDHATYGEILRQMNAPYVGA